MLDAYGQIRVLCVGDQTLYLALALNPAVQQKTAEHQFFFFAYNRFPEGIGRPNANRV